MPELILFGPIPAKKNQLRPRKGKGRKLTYDKTTRAQLDYLKEQIPPELRGLELEHPDMHFSFRLPADNQAHKPWQADWDGMVTAVQDILVYFRVLKEDDFSHCNGRKVVEPAEFIDGLVQETVITLIPKQC